MADNRLYLVCAYCREGRGCALPILEVDETQTLVAKNFGGDWTLWNAEHLEKFLKEHSHGAVPGDNFTLEYEEATAHLHTTI